MSSPGATAPRRQHAVLLASAFFSSSALGLALLATVARWLSPEQYAQFLALWGLVFAFGSALGAVEQEVTRQAARASLDHRPLPWGAVQAVIVAAGGALVALSVVLLTDAGRVIVAHSPVVTALAYLSVTGFAVLVLTRGLLLGRSAFGWYVVVLVGEAVLRLVLVGIVVLAGVDPSIEWATAAIVVGCFSWVVAARHLVLRIDWRGPRLPWRGVVGTVAALAVANGLAALVLTGFPAVATIAIGSSRELGDVFAVITVSRVPLVLLAPVQAMVVPTVIRWTAGGDVARLGRAMRLMLVGTTLATALAAGLGYLLGPWATRLLMGDQYDPAPLACALVLASTCVLGAALLQAAVLVALQRYWTLAGCWSVAVACAGAALVLPLGSAESRALAGFVAASCVAFVATAVAYRTASVPPAVRSEDARG